MYTYNINYDYSRCENYSINLDGDELEIKGDIVCILKDGEIIAIYKDFNHIIRMRKTAKDNE